MELGPEGWLALDDPFPAWRIATDEGEEGESDEEAAVTS
jgi:hypothetical protein